jgi:hypothetical protein
MSSLRLAVLLVAIAAAVSGAGPEGALPQAGQPARPPRDVGPVGPAAERGTGAISGTVRSADSGAPLRRAEITATGLGGQPRTTVTDDEGRFELDAVPSGPWQITASKTGYSSQQHGQRRPFDRAQPVLVRPGERAAAHFLLIRASAIGGRIYDEYGEPLAAARVDVLRARMAQNRRYLQRVGDGDLTDDTGSFRIYGLPPGEYFVTASLRVAPVDSVVQTTYAPTYYPGTGNFAEAQRILLAPGNDVIVDFPVLPFRTARVTGIVVDAAGSPADAFLNLSSEAGELGVPYGIGGATLPDGTFTLPEVPPGTYTLNAALKGGISFGAEVAAIPLAVHGDDISGITLVTAKPGTIRGTIVADAGVTARLPPKISIGARSTRAGAEATFAEPERNAFELTVPIGPFRLRIEPPEGWVVKAIAVDDADATDAVLDLRGRQDVPARVILTNRLSEVSGSIARNPDAAAPSVVIFPYDSAKWEPPSRYVRSVAVARDGTYRIAGLPAGTQYLAAAVDALEEGEAEDPDFLARIRDLATGFDLADAEKRVINLTVIQR